MDLRKRVAKAKGTSFEVAERFDVSASWVRKFRRLVATTGSLLPGRTGHRPRKVDAEGEALIRAWVAAQPDMTIPEVMARVNGHEELTHLGHQDLTHPGRIQALTAWEPSPPGSLSSSTRSILNPFVWWPPVRDRRDRG